MSAGCTKNSRNEEENLSVKNPPPNVPPLFSYSVEDLQLCLFPDETKESRVWFWINEVIFDIH